MRRASFAALFGTVGIIASCSKALAPTAPPAPTAVVVTPAIQTPVLRIIVPPVVPYASIVPLRTEIRTGDSISDCSSSTALWKSSDGDVGVVGYADNYAPPSGNGILYTRQSGFLQLMATCDGLAASAQIRVESPWVPVRITIGDDAPGLLGLPTGGTIEILDGPRAGQSFPESQFPAVTGFTFPLTLRLSAPGYIAKEYLIDHTGCYVPHTCVQGEVQRTVPLTYVGQESTDAFVARWRNSGESRDAAYPFSVTAAGTIEVATQWQNSFDDHFTLTTELWCNSQMLYRDTDATVDPPRRVRFRQTIDGPRACEIRVHRNEQAYRITVTYPH